MIYQDYMRRKMHNVVKLDTKEGYPLTVYNCANKNLKDYTIYGNTVYGENLFNYTEPYNDNQIIADEDGWFDVTIDNTEGTSTAFKSCVTKVNNALKPDTEYILFTEIAECTGSINVQVKTASSNSQFTGASIRYGIAGIYSNTITTFSSFDNCTQMLSSSCYCGAGKSGHAKFRIAVYETQKDEFLPYSKQSVGDKTENLYNYTEPYSDYSGLSDDGWWDVTIDNTEGTSNKLTYRFTKVNTQLKLDTNYYVYVEIAEISGDIILVAVDTNKGSLKGQFATRLTGSGVATTRADFSDCLTMLRTYCYCAAGKSGHIKYRIAVYEVQKDTFEPYDKYKIPILINGNEAAVIFRDAPLADGESINYKNDNLPDIVLEKGTNIITADTEVKPSKIKIKYLKK